MSEKTPRQIGEKSKDLYNDYRVAQLNYFVSDGDLNDQLSNAQRNHNNISAVNEGRPTTRNYKHAAKHKEWFPNHEPLSADEYREKRDAALNALGGAVLKQAEAKDELERSVFDGQLHFEENTAQYHDLAVAEAALDGVKINVSQSVSIDEPVEVHTVR